MSIKAIDYFKDYLTMMPSLYRESHTLNLLMKVIFDVLDEQQKDFIWLADNMLNIDAAEKSHLDFIGSLVGQKRLLIDFTSNEYFGFDKAYRSKSFGSSLDPEVGGYWNSRSHFDTTKARVLTDSEYRRIIRARVISNNSSCTCNDLLEVVNLLTDNTRSVVQSDRHGYISIKTTDPQGFLSYFLDKRDGKDNILPVAAGVDIVLEQM